MGLYAFNDQLNCLTMTSNATVNVVSGGVAPYTYTWLPTGGNASVAVNISPNTYTILVQDAIGCIGTTQLIIFNTTGVSLMLHGTDPTCPGGSDGKIISNVAGPVTPPLTYSWSPAAGNTATAVNQSAGGHTLTVQDTKGCTVTKTISLSQPAPIMGLISTKSITCSGGLSGATVTPTGGTPWYTFSWSPTGGTTNVASNIPAGTYSVSITDSRNCQLTETLTITQPPVLVSNLSTTNVACNGDSTGAASANASGGFSAYTYSWMPVNSNATQVNNLSSGNYTLQIKDAKNCVLNHTFTISQPAPFTYIVNRTDEFCVNADGTATLVLNGGTAPYTYTWNTLPVQTGSVAAGLVAGSYTAYITDSKNCVTNIGVTIGNISNLNPSIISKANVTCNSLCNGNATAGITGGSPPFSFNWLGIPSGTAATVSNLCVGQYTVKITDTLGCYTFTTVSITEPPPITTSLSGSNLICSGQQATLSITATGGSPGYSYQWQPANLSGSVAILSPTSTTGYSVTATDTNGCKSTKLFSVSVNAPLSLNSSASSLTVCPNVNATISVAPSGGDGAYTYTWFPGNVNTQSITVNLQSSTVYTVIIKDGCGTTPASSTVNVTIHQTKPPTFTSGNTKGCEPLCVQFSNTSEGSTAIQWSFGDFSPAVMSPVVTHCYNKPGTYTVIVSATDANGCKSILKLDNYITVYGKPRADFIHEPTIIDLNSPDASFLNTSVNASNFIWVMDGLQVSSEKNFNHLFSEDKCYVLKLIAANENFCSDTTEQQLCITEGYNFYAPNAFTPDGNGKNEIFIPKGTGWKTDNYNFEIFDRWGNLVFKTSDVAEGWNGKMFGSKATDDVYVWKIKVVDLYDYEHEYYGKVILMR
jgi:gliding motility-associated-like protein